MMTESEDCACGRHATHKTFSYRPAARVFGPWEYAPQRWCCACYVRLGYPPVAWHPVDVAVAWDMISRAEA